MSQLVRRRLLISLAGIAALARVRRPVVSMWRRRSHSSDTPFPSPIREADHREFFDADEVAHWLVETGRGKNPDAVAEAPLFATLEGFPLRDERNRDALTSLIALRGATGEPVESRHRDAVIDAADAVDPDDLAILREIEAMRDELDLIAPFAGRVVDAAWSPAEAFERVMSRVSVRDRDRLSAVARSFVAQLAVELARSIPGASSTRARFADVRCSAADLIMETLQALPESVEPVVVTSDVPEPVVRSSRRRMLAHGVTLEPIGVGADGDFSLSGPVVHIDAHLQYENDEAALLDVDNLVLQMDDEQRAIVIGPASLLADDLGDPSVEDARSRILRSGRVRAIVRLPRGLVVAHPRQVLAMWVLGPAHSVVAIADRWIMTADLIDAELDESSRQDLVSDLVASMGDRATVRAHAFRFARLVLARSVLASRGALVGAPTLVRHQPRSQQIGGQERLVMLDDLLSRLGEDAARLSAALVATDPRTVIAPASVEALIRDKRLSCISGMRIDDEALGASEGHTVIGSDELALGSVAAAKRIDRLTLVRDYPTARLTEPGDIVFRAGMQPAALVDQDGLSVVRFPARILRISAEDPAGLTPAIVAADINRQRSSEWRRWMLRRVANEQRGPLMTHLAGIRERQTELRLRLALLDELSDLLADGVVAGHVSLSPHTPEPEGTR